ncbi:aldose epimerase family protein [Neobacillus sp. GCM10023253]|uniref:aldose epimerase family protein n=1 Tax=Neobacillus sp. GCM10023253 TaxID=3252644 RepID=UPI0036146E98
MKVVKEEFGRLLDQPISAYTLKNDNGIEITCLDYGCIISAIKAPDRNGHIENIVLGFDQLDDYLKWSPYFGAVIGRVAGRIKGAQFELNSKTYVLSNNENRNHLHGGERGFHNVCWKTKMIQSEGTVGVQFSYFSPDAEEGYPGNLHVNVSYLLTNQNELVISYHGTTDEDTLLNLTNHSYFNLSGNMKRDILEHFLKLNSSSFLELDSEFIPTGTILNVDRTPFDFRNGRALKEGVLSSHLQNKLVGTGYDHPFILNDNHPIYLMDYESGRCLTVATDQAAVVLYTGNQIPSGFSIQGVKSRKYLGVCLETQGLPDAIHHSHFPSIVLKKGDEYHAKTTYTFSVFK